LGSGGGEWGRDCAAGAGGRVYRAIVEGAVVFKHLWEADATPRFGGVRVLIERFYRCFVLLCVVM